MSLAKQNLRRLSVAGSSIAVLALGACAIGSAAELIPPPSPGEVSLPPIRYTVLRAGPPEGAQPTRKDTVTVNYDVRVLDGAMVDSSYARGGPSRFAVGRLIPAWQIVLPLMRPGDHWRVVVPAAFAYGAAARGDIPPNSTLIFRIELIAFAPTS